MKLLHTSMMIGVAIIGISGMTITLLGGETSIQKISPTQGVQSINTITYHSIDNNIHPISSFQTISLGRKKSPQENIINYYLPYLPSDQQILYDTDSDDSKERYVSRMISLHDSHYIPGDLEMLSGSFFTLPGSSVQLRSEALQQLTLLAKEFYDIFSKKIVIVSAYRSYSYQQVLKKGGCPDTLCAPAGHSEHQLGLAVDLFAATTADEFLSKAEFKKYYDRLALNAHRYGWHNTYQKGVDIDTYQIEPRHRRYLGRDLATELFNQKMTFGEWIKNYIKK